MAALVGGTAGSYAGCRRLATGAVECLLAIVLIVASAKSIFAP